MPVTPAESVTCGREPRDTIRYAALEPQQLQQLGEVRRHAARIVLGEQLQYSETSESRGENRKWPGARSK